MMYLYDQNELSFQRNGKTIQNAFNAKVVHYLNSEYTLTFSVLMSDEIAKDLEINKIVFAENQPFRITTIQPSLKEFKVYARHVFFDLLDYQVENVNVNSVTGQTVMNAIFSSNDTNFTYTSDITKRSTMNDSKKNIVEMLARAIERFEGELKRDKFSVALNNSIGKDTNYVVYPNKNISSSVKETDISSVCTRVIVEYGEYEDVKQVIVVSENVNLYPQAKTKRYQNLDLKTEADAIAWGKGKFQGINRIDVPKVSIEIDLSLDRELSGLEIGDTLICKIPTLKLDERIQIIGYEFDPSMNLRTKIFVGFKAKGLSGTINNSVVEAIRPEIADVDDKLQQQINEANEAIQKEYEERIDSVNGAIAKAEVEVEVMKEEIANDIENEFLDLASDSSTKKVSGNLLIENTVGADRIIANSIGANQLVVGTAEIAEITSRVMSTEALNAAWANIGNAFINKLTSDDALFQRLTAKTAWITSANIVSLEASSIKGKVLSSTNGGLKFDLDGNALYLTENSRISYWNNDSNIASEMRYGTNTYFPGSNSAIEDTLGIGNVSIAGSNWFCNNYGTVTGIYQVPGKWGTSHGKMLLHAEDIRFNSFNPDMPNQGIVMIFDRSLGNAHSSATQLFPRNNGKGILGKTDKAWNALHAYNIVDLYSSTLSDDSYQNETLQINALDIVNGATVEQATPIMTLNEENDGKRQLLGINLNKAKLTADDEMPTLNEEIAILWKAVQELSEQNKKLQEQIDLLK